MGKIFCLFIFMLATLSVASAEPVLHDPNLRDPTTPLRFHKAQKKMPSLQLQAIYVRNNSRQAIVNGQLVNVGSRVAGAQITAISDNRVTYSAAGSPGVLYLRPKVSKATN